MTLVNVDKDTNDRVNPTVNAPDVQMNPMGHATSSISPRAQGTQGAGKVVTKDSKIIANDGLNNIGLFGFDDAGNMVVKVAKPGFDANSATDDQLIFNSGQDVFKIVEKGSSSIPSFTVGTGQTRVSLVTIPHGLSFTPIVDLYVSGSILNLSLGLIASSYIPLPVFISQGAIQYYFLATSTSYYPLTIIYGVDATNIYVEAYDGGGTFSADTIENIPFTYFLRQETAT